MRILTLVWNTGSGGSRRPRPKWGLSTVINYDQQFLTSLTASDDSPKGGNPSLCVPVRIRRWDNLEDPPQRHFPQLVCDWLYGILGV